jgi:hypothetical protein
VSRSEATDNEQNATRETLCIQATTDTYVLRYEKLAHDRQLAIDFVGRGELRIAAQHAQTRVNFSQPASGKLKLTVATGDQTQVVEGSTLWHLLIAEPTLCETHLLPLLDLLNGDWQLRQQVHAVELQLLANAGEETRLSQETVEQLVEKLGESSFAVRQAAYRELISQGPAVLPHLATLTAQGLDAEQRARLADVRDTFAYSSADTTERITAWLSADREAWQALAHRHDPKIREVAERELQRLK